VEREKTSVLADAELRDPEAAQNTQAPVTWGDPGKFRILGKRYPRVEGPDKVTGRAKYTYDIRLPGMLYGRIVRSKYAAARINSPADVDTSDAEKIPGVKAIIKLVPAGGKNIRFAGEEIAAVAATTPEIATDAAKAIERKINYQPQPFVVDQDKAAQPDAPKVRPDEANVNGGGRSNKRGNVEEAFKNAAVVHEGTYQAQTRLHCCLEPHGHVVKIDGDQATVWASTQNVSEQGNWAGKQTRIICEHMGGGFGSKFGPGPEGQACADLARMAKAPVKLMLTREDEQVMNYRGPGLRAHIRLAASADGTFLASDIHTTGDGGTDPMNGSALGEGGYIIVPDAVNVEQGSILTNAAGTSALRAPGHPQASWCWDSALDDLAAKLKMDPLEFRMKNHHDPVRVEEWKQGAELIGWSRRNKTPGEGTGPIRRGIGMASATWGGGGQPGSIVDVVVGRDGTVTASCGTQDIGSGARTYIAAILAEDLGLEIKDVTPRVGDSKYPPGQPSGGSTTTGSVAPAAKMASIDLRQKMLPIVAKHATLGAEPAQAFETLEFGERGHIRVKNNPEKRISWKEACSMLPAEGLKARGELDKAKHDALARGGVAGCCFAEVEVDTETGKVRPVKIVSVQDCGQVLNLMQAESQVIGGITQGIAQALLEYRQMDNLTGRMLNPNLEDYKLTHAREIPEVVVKIFPTNTGRVSGIGEPCVIPVNSAIGNAVFNAIGVRIADAPITPDKVLRALGERRGGTA